MLTPLANETVLVLQARRGDQAAFVALVEHYQTPVYNLCARMLGDRAEAEEAAQEAFMRAYDRLASFDPARSFKTWLLAIAGHYCIDRLRRRHWHWLSIEDDDLPAHPALREPAAGPEEAAVRREQVDAVQTLLDELPPRDRRLLVLYYWHDLPCAEIARMTGTTVAAVKSRLHRARAELAARMGANSPLNAGQAAAALT